MKLLKKSNVPPQLQTHFLHSTYSLWPIIKRKPLLEDAKQHVQVSWFVVGLRPIASQGTWADWWSSLSSVYGSFGENYGKFWMARLTSATGEWNSHLSFTSSSSITSRSLVGQQVPVSSLYNHTRINWSCVQHV